MNQTAPVTASPSGTSEFHTLDEAVQAAGLPTLFECPCDETWEYEAKVHGTVFSRDLQPWDDEEWIDLHDDSWDKLTPVRWTETAGTRALPEAEIKFVLRNEDEDFGVWESGYIAKLLTFTETAVYLPKVWKTVYVCEATYEIARDFTSKVKS